MMKTVLERLGQAFWQLFAYFLLFAISWGVNHMVILVTARGIPLLNMTTGLLYLGVWVLSVIAALLGKSIWAWTITESNILGVALGLTLGQYLESVEYFGYGYGTPPATLVVWLATVGAGFLLGFFLELLVHLIRTPRKTRKKHGTFEKIP